MRIDDLNRSSLTQGADQSSPASAQRTQAKESTDAAQDAAAGSDQVQVSSLAQSLAAPGSSRVEQLRIEVQSGSYNVPASAVASALIDAHLQD
jgi:anti-sigma28 factor (negative regulator of flagellin synthesis)